MSWVITITKKYEVLSPDATEDDVERRIRHLQEQHPDVYFDVNWVEPSN